jgi:hypothetical protein
MALQGNTWVQNAEPTINIQACQEWIQPSTATRFFRNTSNTAWVNHGSINEPLGGAVAVAGGAMTGPLSGAHGLPPMTNPDFDDGAFTEGLRLATVTDVINLQKYLMGRISKEIRQTFLSLKKLETVAVNPTLAQSLIFWMLPVLPINTLAPNQIMELRDPITNSELYEVSPTSMTITESGYYLIKSEPIQRTYSWETRSGNVDDGYSYTTHTHVARGDAAVFINGVRANFLPYAALRGFTAKHVGGGLAYDLNTYVDAAVVPEWDGTPLVVSGIHVVKLNAGDVLTFEYAGGATPAGVNQYMFDGCAFMPTVVEMLLVTLL